MKRSFSGRALLVGDGSPATKTVSRCLKAANFSVLTALTASAAEHTLETSDIRIVVAFMSAMSGSGLLFIDEVRRRGFNTKLVALSENPRLCKLADCMGVRTVLTSPLRIDYLKAALEVERSPG